ncbi:MAG: hypothetical protein AAFQ98_20985 [Bacteroidota bacterium]
MSTAMTPFLSYTSPGILWQVLPLEKDNGWLLEERFPEGEVVYCRIDETGNEVWQVQPWPEKWWTHLAAVTNSQVLVREYANEQTPEHQHLHALNLADGLPQWDVENFSMVAVSDTIAYGYLSNGNTKVWSSVSLDSGQILSTNESASIDQENNPVVRPFLYREEDARFDTVREFILQGSGETPIWGAEYLETDFGVGLSWYAIGPNKKGINHFWWMDSRGQRVLELELGTGLAGMGQDTFWVYSNKLFFIKDKKDLVGYAL